MDNDEKRFKFGVVATVLQSGDFKSIVYKYLWSPSLPHFIPMLGFAVRALRLTLRFTVVAAHI